MAALGAMIVVLGTLISFAVTCVYFLMGNKKWKKALICIPICLFGGTFIFALSPEGTSSTTDENTVVSVVDEEEMVQEENTPIAENIEIEVEAEPIEIEKETEPVKYDFPSGMEQFINGDYPYISPEDLGKYFSNMSGVTFYTIVKATDFDEPSTIQTLIGNEDNGILSNFDVGGKYETYNSMLKKNDAIAIIATANGYDFSILTGATAYFKDCTIFAKGKETESFIKDTTDERLAEYLVLTDTVAETADIELTEEEFKGLCNYLSYNDILRNPDSYEKKYCIVEGRVSQVIEGFFGNSIFLKDSNGNQWGCTYSYEEGESHILEGDYITVYGKCNGTTKATTLLGKQVIMPSVSVEYYE